MTRSLVGKMVALRRKRERGKRLTLAERTMLDAWDNKQLLPEAVETFFDGYGHDSNATCSRRGEQVVGQLLADALVTGQRIEAGANRALPAIADGPEPGRWQGIGDRLAEIERMP